VKTSSAALKREPRCFDFGAFVVHLVEFLRVMGAGSHVVAVCQPCVAVLAAAALMAEAGDAAQPRGMTLMAGPIDTRINPTKVNELAIQKPIAWFEQNLIAKVPHGYKGATRQVYPGFMQLAAFMSMNLERHLRSFKDMVEAHAAGDQSKFQLIQAFYQEYFAVMDLPAEFFLETVKLIFQDHALPLGKLEVHGRPVNPGAIKRTALLTVEGERYLRPRPNPRRAGPLHGIAAIYEDAPRADGGWPLRRLQRPPLEQRNLPHGIPMTPRSSPRR
jgi:poly(3-hydroxybutyrate) depolymerase